jgi:hypothetical protein
MVITDPDGGEVAVEVLGAADFTVKWRWGRRDRPRQQIGARRGPVVAHPRPLL